MHLAFLSSSHCFIGLSLLEITHNHLTDYRLILIETESKRVNFLSFFCLHFARISLVYRICHSETVRTPIQATQLQQFVITIISAIVDKLHHIRLVAIEVAPIFIHITDELTRRLHNQCLCFIYSHKPNKGVNFIKLLFIVRATGKMLLLNALLVVILFPLSTEPGITFI